MSGAHCLLLRHPDVAAGWRGRCYGQTDAGLSRTGAATARRLANALAARPPDAVFASPQRRARLPAARIAVAFGVPLHLDGRLSERFFGRWEGLRWDAIWAETGSAMDGMIDAPDHFRPGGGETTNELAKRVAGWFRTLPCQAIVAVTHGGPIAALVGTLRDEPVRDWLRHIPAPGEGFQLTARTDGWTIVPWRLGRAGQ